MARELSAPETGGSSDRRRFGALGAVLGWVVIAVLAYFIWPASLGGGTTAIVVNGHSMEPTYYTGDIVVARAAEPQVGDVIVYSTLDLDGSKIVHRIIGGDGVNGWQVQGDNNDYVDPFYPTNEDVLGVAKLHIPKLGLWAAILRSPLVWGSILLIAVGFTMWPSRPEELDVSDDVSDDEDGSSAGIAEPSGAEVSR
ncbi:signal peptidase I [Demequina globuliformis]|uniref:signal peptidase I n=1 Tax=Demequina globuliformis TaxID=676202 RepID=UPI00078642E2|nr:signal peptidase I [Demequina globuliformis]